MHMYIYIPWTHTYTTTYGVPNTYTTTYVMPDALVGLPWQHTYTLTHNYMVSNAGVRAWASLLEATLVPLQQARLMLGSIAPMMQCETQRNNMMTRKDSYRGGGQEEACLSHRCFYCNLMKDCNLVKGASWPQYLQSSWLATSDVSA